MRIGDVFRSLAGGVVVYLLATACADAAKRPDGTNATAATGGASGNGKDTGGAPSMNGDAGSHSGTGATAHAATGGDATGGECECPTLPEPEPDVVFERECNVPANVGAQKYGVLELPGASLADLARVKVFAVSNETVTGMPEGHTVYVPAISYGAGAISGSCQTSRNERVVFHVPAELAP